MFTWAQPDPQRRAAGLRPLFAATLRHCRRRGAFHGVGDGQASSDVLAAVAGWVPATSLDLGPLDLLRSGLVATPVWLGPQATVRIERHERPSEARLVAHRREHDAYLWLLGADPVHQGTGAGRAALQRALTAMATTGHDRCLLRTDDAANVPWYERQGFEVVEHLDALPSGLPSWILAHPLP